MFRFTIRDVLWLTVVVGMGVVVDGSQAAFETKVVQANGV